jgi:hypothetical protein
MLKAPPGIEPGMADLQSATPTPQPVAQHDTSGNGNSPLTVLLTGTAEKTCEPVREIDPNLSRVVSAWPDLPPHIRAAVMALVGTAR